MVKELDLSMVSQYTGRVTKAMSKRPSRSGITCGWEWEIPIRQEMGGYSGLIPSDDAESDENYPFSRAWAKARGFNAHFDSGGREIGSPVFDNLGTARRFAKYIQHTAGVNRVLEPDTYQSNCGIHVHVADARHETSMVTELRRAYYSMDRDTRSGHLHMHDYFADGSEDYREYERNRTFMDRVLNRSSSYGFLRDISGRDLTQSGYSVNARSAGWDETQGHGNLPPCSWVNASMMRANLAPGGTFEEGDREAPDTIEFRIWKGVSERLLPAIEFAHGFYKWGRAMTPRIADDLDAVFFPRCARGRISTYNPNRMMTGQEVGIMRELIPTIGDFTDWLDGQKGYHNLKAQLGGYGYAQ